MCYHLHKDIGNYKPFSLVFEPFLTILLNPIRSIRLQSQPNRGRGRRFPRASLPCSCL